MGITKDPTPIHDPEDDQEDDNEVSSSCAEDELLTDWGQVHHLGPRPMPMKEQLELQLSQLGKRCPHDRPRVIVVIIGFAALVALAVAATTALRQSSARGQPVAAERAELQHDLTDTLGADFKAADYKDDHNLNPAQQHRHAGSPWTDHTHPEQWQRPTKTFLQPHHSLAAQPQSSPAAGAGAQPSRTAEQAQLDRTLNGALGANFQNEATAYSTDHDRPGQRAPPAHARHGGQACNFRTSATCSARSLFHSAEMHRVVTDNMMRTTSRLLSQADYEMVNEFAWMGFERISKELTVRAPDVAQSLDAVHLRREQKNAVLDVMALLSDVSVEGLGYNVAKIIRASTFATRKYLKFSLEDSLEPVDEIREMAHSLLPESVVEAWKANTHDDWGLTLSPENIRSMRQDTIKPNATGAGVDFKTKSLSVYAGVLQQGKVLLEIMRTYIVATGPSWSVGTHDAMAPLLNSITPPAAKDKLDYMETFLWPLKCSSQGLDALRVGLCPKFGTSFKGHGERRDARADIGALASSAEKDIGSKLKSGAEGLSALRAEFKR